MRTSTVRCENCGRRNRIPATAAGVPKCGNCHRPLPWLVDAGDDDFAEIVERADLPVLVDMWATWCGPCRMVSPALERLARERAGRVKLVKVDVDAAQQLARRFNVMSVPTLLVMRGDEIVAQQTGAAPVHVLRDWLDQAIGTPESTGQEART